MEHDRTVRTLQNRIREEEGLRAVAEDDVRVLKAKSRYEI